MIQRSTLALGVCVALLGGGSVAHAHEVAIGENIEVPEGSGYVTVGGNALRTATGECVRLSGFSEENQVNACEGIEEVVEAPAPSRAEPAPAPEPVPEPTQVAKVELREVGEEANFEFDSADLSAEGQAAMEELFGELAEYKGVTEVNVVGHTDSTGPEEYNLQLSERRAATVAAMLAERYPDATVNTEGRGETDPVATNETREGRQQNRRVEIEVTASRMTFE